MTDNTYLDEIPEFPGERGGDSIVKLDKRRGRMPRVLTGLVPDDSPQVAVSSRPERSENLTSTGDERDSDCRREAEVGNQETLNAEPVFESNGAVVKNSSMPIKKVILFGSLAIVLVVSLAAVKTLFDINGSMEQMPTSSAAVNGPVKEGSQAVNNDGQQSPWADERGTVASERAVNEPEIASRETLSRSNHNDQGDYLIQKAFEQIEAIPDEVPVESIEIDINDINQKANISSRNTKEMVQPGSSEASLDEQKIRTMITTQLEQYYSATEKRIAEDTSEFQQLKNDVGNLKSQRVAMATAIVEQDGQIMLSQRAIAEIAGTINLVKDHIGSLKKEAAELRSRLEQNVAREAEARRAPISTASQNSDLKITDRNKSEVSSRSARGSGVQQLSQATSVLDQEVSSPQPNAGGVPQTANPLVITNFRVEMMGSRAAKIEHLGTGRKLLAMPGQSIGGLGRIDRLDRETATIYVTLEDGRSAIIRPTEKLSNYAHN